MSAGVWESVFGPETAEELMFLSNVSGCEVRTGTSKPVMSLWFEIST